MDMYEHGYVGMYNNISLKYSELIYTNINLKFTNTYLSYKSFFSIYRKYYNKLRYKKKKETIKTNRGSKPFIIFWYNHFVDFQQLW